LAYYAFGKKYEMAICLREIHNKGESMHILAGFADSPPGWLGACGWWAVLRRKMGKKII